MESHTLALFKEHAIIPPPESKDVFRTKRILIDSRDRNTKLHPNPNQYTIKIDEGLEDVVSVELAISDFPFNEYNITVNNNRLHVSVQSSPNVYQEITIKPGKYDGEQLAEALQMRLVEIITSSGVSFDVITSTLTFSGMDGCTFNFKNETPRKFDDDNLVYDYRPRSIGRVLGFLPEAYLASTEPLTAPHPVDLRNESYIIMNLQRAKVYLSQNNVANQCFAILRLENNDKWLSTLNTEPVRKSFKPPIPDMSSLRFKFVDYYGNAYDFQNKEHRFELIVKTLKQGRKYSEMAGFN